MRTLGPRVVLAATSISAIAGFVDAVAFIHLGGYFVSFMSGNTTRGSVDLSQLVSSPAFPLVGAFVLGVIGGAALSGMRRLRQSAVLLLVTALLAAAAVVGMVAPDSLVFALLAAASMGAINNLFTRDGEAAFGLTYMTGALVKFGQGVVSAVTGGDRTAWWRYLVLWLGIACGAVVGALTYGVLGLAALWVAVIGLGIATAVRAYRDRSAGRPA